MLLDPAPLAASFTDVFVIVVGVLLSLSGLGILLMGLIALADRRWKRGGAGAAAGVVLVAVGLLLVGVI